MGLIYGVYDAKPQGFAPGNSPATVVPHGPTRDAFNHASNSR